MINYIQFSIVNYGKIQYIFSREGASVTKNAVDSNFQKQLALSMPEVIRMLGNVQIPPSGCGGILDEKKEGEKEEDKEVSDIPRRQ
jgi:hypothetical protein